MSRTSSNRFFSIRNAVRTREVLLLVLLAILAGLSMYVARTDTTAFGLLTKPIQQDFVPVVLNFHTEVLDSTPLLELRIDAGKESSATQVQSELINPSVPPAPLTIDVANARTGAEVVVTWTLPESSLTLLSNVYRSGDTEGTEQLIAEHITATSWKDTTVVEGETYTYRIASAVADGDTWYESEESVKATVTALDTIAPAAPTNVLVQPIVNTEGKDVLEVTWIHPEDAAEVRVYRSAVHGSRGELVATVLITQSAEYLDNEAPDNTPVWYTLVSVDAAGNTSSEDFALPMPGNANPFNYGVLVQ